MNRFNISTRLIFLIAILFMLLIGIGGIGLYGLAQSNEAQKSVFEDRLVPVGQIAEIQRLLLRNRLAIAESLNNSNPALIRQKAQDITDNIQSVSKIWQAYMATELTAEESAIASDFAENRARLVLQVLQPTVAALLKNDLNEAQRLATELLRPLQEPVSRGAEKLIQLQLDVARHEYEAALARYATIRMISIGAIGAGMLFALLFGGTLIRNMSASLASAVAFSNAIAAGNLNQAILAQGQDEVAHLLNTLSAMQEKLTAVVSRVRQGSESVADASVQIAAGNHDLSARTEQQASALEETAASMEQLSATVKQNADSVGQARQMALNASDTAIRAGAEVLQVVATMRHINESAREIADIIGVIDGIAFQTNILALNAAVEAARAGEQGRGFAVVANEVRSLAGRSAEAAKQIKLLINASVERVTQGSVLVNQAGTTMSEVVHAITVVTDLMSVVSTASNEQSQGVAEIGHAIVQMDQVTQQNAVLVEQMAAAASHLQQQAQDLVETVSVFNLSADSSTSSSPSGFSRAAHTPQLSLSSTFVPGIRCSGK